MSNSDVVVLHRRNIDRLLIGLGLVVTIVLVVAGALLTWGHNFADDYVGKELRAQNIYFPPKEALDAEGRGDLNKYAGVQLVNGNQAEAYASYIDGHLKETAEGKTYADLGTPERAAKAAVTEATKAGKSAEEIATLQAEADKISGQRNSLFKGETLRGLLLSTYAWSTIGRIAGIAAVVAYIAAVAMLLLVAAGVVHIFRKPKTA